MNLLRLARKPATTAVADGPRAVHGVVHGGQSGVGIFHHGKMTAWGANETAAWASHQVATVAKSARIVAVPVAALRPRIRR